MKRMMMWVVAVMLLAAGRAAGEDMAESQGRNVKECIEASHRLPDVSKSCVRDVPMAKVKEVFERRKYQLGVMYEGMRLPGKFTVVSMEWNTEKRIHDEQIRVLVVIGDSDPNDARAGLFQMMAMSTNMRIRPDTFEVLEDGPGDFSVVHKRSASVSNEGISVWGSLSFVRDNIGIRLACSSKINLLPVAREIDAVIGNCPKKNKPRIGGH